MRPFPHHWPPISLLHWAELMTCGTLQEGHVLMWRLEKTNTDIDVYTFFGYDIGFVHLIAASKTIKHFQTILFIYHTLKELHESLTLE